VTVECINNLCNCRCCNNLSMSHD